MILVIPTYKKKKKFEFECPLFEKIQNGKTKMSIRLFRCLFHFLRTSTFTWKKFYTYSQTYLVHGLTNTWLSKLARNSSAASWRSEGLYDSWNVWFGWSFCYQSGTLHYIVYLQITIMDTHRAKWSLWNYIVIVIKIESNYWNKIYQELSSLFGRSWINKLLASFFTFILWK